MHELVMTPAECVALINQTLEMAYPTLLVEGEVASFKYSQGKYVFFDLKDDQATLGCFMMAWQLSTPLEDGMKVKILAEPRLTRWGKFSLTVRQVMPVGEGSIKKAFALLRAKLETEGLLDENRKRSLPKIPRRIGVVSSTEAAGYADFIKILNARWGGVEVLVAHVQVQGLSAAAQNMAAIAYFNQQADPVDVLVIVRGGGSADDLAAYNDEQLARAIAASRIPTLVGVGHEVDVSLADLVADVRAATPSNAAQLLVPDKQEVLHQLGLMRQRLEREAGQVLVVRQQIVRHSLQRLAHAVDMQTPLQKVRHMREHLHAKERHLLEQTSRLVQGHRRALRQLDPQLVLQRGYALVRANGQLADSVAGIAAGQAVEVRLRDGSLQTTVIDVVKDKDKV